MRARMLLLALPLLLADCSCGRHPGNDASPADPAATDTPAANVAPAPAQASPSSDGEASTPLPEGAREAAATVHRYLALLQDPDPGRSDGYWSGGKPAPHPDDANLRALQGLRSLRVRNGTPRALDQQSPTQTVEVPVQLVASSDSGTRRFTGWYRLRRRVDGSGWELTAASLQPVLD